MLKAILRGGFLYVPSIINFEYQEITPKGISFFDIPFRHFAEFKAGGIPFQT